MRIRSSVAAVVVTSALALPAGAAASPLLSATTTGAGAHLQVCHAATVRDGAAVRTWRTTATDSGVVLARLRGARKSDWDVGVLGTGGRFVAGAAGPSSREIASGFVTKGEPLTVRACLVRGAASKVAVRLDSFPVALDARRSKVQILAVDTPTRADRNRLMALGFDDAHSGSPSTLDIVAGPADYDRLRAAGFSWSVKVDDLVALERLRAKADQAFADRVDVSEMPSGATGYRHLADIETELKKLAQEHPGLVKLITLPHKSLEGRDVMGVEIAQNVNVSDGKPVFFNMGVHHAREWPSAEHALEWAYDLVKGYGKDARVTKLVDSVRAIVVPVVNVDGFNLSREAPVDPGNAAAMVDIPPDVDNQLPLPDPTYTAVLLADQNAGTFAYKRRNCRIKDGATPAPGECENPDNRTLGTDPNRNYGGFWGGGGAAVETTDDTYRGASPFSEPETQNVRETVLHNQVGVLITNHTFSNLVLRPPGIKAEGSTPDEALYKTLGDSMAANNGYASQFGYQLYDTTGTTEDWSYFATGGFGFTFEIGPDEFHPPYSEVVDEYAGAGEHAGKGNREAYLVAMEWAADRAKHAVLTGSGTPGATLRLRKAFQSETSPVIQDAHGLTGRPLRFEDVIDTTMTVPDDGRFEWHVNQSTRPYVQKTRRYTDVSKTPASTQDISSPTPEVPGLNREIEFDVKPGATRQVRAGVEGSSPDDYDIYLYKGSVAPENQVASSASADAQEVIVYNNAEPGKYVLEVVNYSAAQPYSGRIETFGEEPGSEVVVPAHDEAYDLTCETAAGKVLARSKVEVRRGEVKALGNPCVAGAAKRGALKLTLKLKGKRKLRGRAFARRGVTAVATCSRECTLSVFAKANRRTAKRLGLGRAVARARTVTFTGRRTLRLRVGKAAARKLRGAHGVKLTVRAVARSGDGVTRTKRLRLLLR